MIIKWTTRMKFKKLSQEKWLFLITFLGLILRFYKIKERFVWGSEQSLSLWPIVRMFEEKKLPLIGVHLLNYKSALFRPPFFIYIFALPLKIFRFNPFVLEIIFSLIGIINPIIIYFTAKKIFNKQTGLIAAFLYTLSTYVINTDKSLWTITPIIITSTLIVYFISKLIGRSNLQLLYFFTIGCLTGLGFSFHFQAAILFIALLLTFLSTKKFKGSLLFLAGFIFLISPLIVFNLRHDFIMIKGLGNLFYGEQVIRRQNLSLGGKINNGLSAFSGLALSLLNISTTKFNLLLNILLFLLLFLIPFFLVKKTNESKSIKLFLQYYLWSCLFGLLDLIIIDQGFYSSTAFYLWFLIPSLLIIWAQSLSLLIKTKIRPVVVLTLIIFGLTNFYIFIKQKPTDYREKIKIVDYILQKANGKNFTLKFINKDALVYDYLFYYRAPFYKLTFNHINLLEQWHEGNPDFYLIQGDYNWQEDKYRILPYKKIVDFSGVKVITKTEIE